jgi:hypothetical protein
MGQAREKDDDLVALAGLLAFGEVEMVAIELGEVLSFDHLDQETQKPVIEAQIVEGCGEISGSAEVVIELTQETKRFIIPKGAVRRFANLAEEMIDARIR